MYFSQADEVDFVSTRIALLLQTSLCLALLRSNMKKE